MVTGYQFNLSPAHAQINEPQEFLAICGNHMQRRRSEMMAMREVDGVQELVPGDHRPQLLVRDHLATGHVQDPQRLSVHRH